MNHLKITFTGVMIQKIKLFQFSHLDSFLGCQKMALRSFTGIQKIGMLIFRYLSRKGLRQQLSVKELIFLISIFLWVKQLVNQHFKLEFLKPCHMYKAINFIVWSL